MKLTYTRPKPLLFIRENIRSPYAPPSEWINHIPFWLRGFSSEQISLYALRNKSTDEYFPDFLKYRFTVRTNKDVWPILHDKLLFDSFMTGRVPISKLLAVSTGSGAMAIQDGWTLDRALEELAAGAEFVVKPLRGGGGGGLKFVSVGDEGALLVNKTPMPRADFASWFERLDYHGIYERIEQHPDFAALNPRTTNTLRIAIFRRKNHAPEMLSAFLRVGVKRSEPVDNTNLGGITILVTEEGRTEAAYARDVRGVGTLVSAHPDTGAELIGLQMPYWKETLELLKRFHEEHTLFDFVGWDVAITPNGPIIFEANHNPSLRGTQFFAPLRSIPNFREFCEERGVL